MLLIPSAGQWTMTCNAEPGLAIPGARSLTRFARTPPRSSAQSNRYSAAPRTLADGGAGPKLHSRLITAIAALSTVANPVHATSGTASSAAGWSARRASRA